MTLHDYMQAHGIRDAELAQKLGVSRPYVSRLRRGKRQPSLPVAAKLEELTGIPARQFAGLQ